MGSNAGKLWSVWIFHVRPTLNVEPHQARGVGGGVLPLWTDGLIPSRRRATTSLNFILDFWSWNLWRCLSWKNEPPLCGKVSTLSHSGLRVHDNFYSSRLETTISFPPSGLLACLSNWDTLRSYFSKKWFSETNFLQKNQCSRNKQKFSLSLRTILWSSNMDNSVDILVIPIRRFGRLVMAGLLNQRVLLSSNDNFWRKLVLGINSLKYFSPSLMLRSS